MGALTGRVAVVAGATRGSGRGIAAMLGEAGATVYCTGRSVRGRTAMAGRPEAIEDTAELVTAKGGRGIAVQCDHAQPEQVAALFAQVEAEQGALHLLVNDIWGGDPLTQWGTPYWELDLERGFRLVRQAVDTHIITARLGTPLLLRSPGSLLVEVTDGNHFGYRGTLFYDLVKTSVMRLAFAMARELQPHGVTALAVTPGFLRSEAMLDHFGVTEENWRDGIKADEHFAASETPYFVGRAIAALAADPDVTARAGRVFSSWDLSDDYGFTDIDGARPHWGNHWKAHFGEPIRACDDAFYHYWFHDAGGS